MIGKIVHVVKAAISPAKPLRPPIEYHDQKPWTIRHSSLDAQHEQQLDGWCNGYGRYRTNGWFNKR